MQEQPAVPLRTLLRPSTYRVFRVKAAELGTTPEVLLSRLADAAVKPRTELGRRAAGKELDAKIRAMNAQKVSDNEISRRLGVALSTVARHRNAMGLPVVGRGGRPKKVTEKTTEEEE